VSSLLKIGSMSPIVIRVAHKDWCASRKVVSVMFTGLMATSFDPVVKKPKFKRRMDMREISLDRTV